MKSQSQLLSLKSINKHKKYKLSPKKEIHDYFYDIYSPDEIALFQIKTEYSMNVALKDRLKFFLEVEYANPEAHLHKSIQLKSCKASRALISKQTDRGSIIVLARRGYSLWSI